MAGTHNAPQSANEALLQNILGEENELREPQSRNEKILHNILGANYPLDAPQSRIEELLLEILEQGLGKEEITLNATENGTYEAPDGQTYNPVNVDVDIYALALSIVTGSITEIPPEMFKTQGHNQIFLRTMAFSYCPYLLNVNLPEEVVSLGSSTFLGCGNLETLECYCGMSGNALSNCSKLKSVLVKKRTGTGDVSIGDSAFWNCTELKKVDIRCKTNMIASYAFRNCSSLETILLRDESYVTVARDNAFSNMPTTTKIYVPDDLVNNYKSASNWNAIASQIYPLSEYVEEE